MVRAFVVSGIHAAETSPYEEGCSAVVIGRERRRNRLLNRRPTGEFIAEGRRTRARADQLETLLEEVIQAAKSAEDKKMDPAYVCRRFAEIMGLRAPLEPLVGTKTEPEPSSEVTEPLSDREIE